MLTHQSWSEIRVGGDTNSGKWIHWEKEGVIRQRNSDLEFNSSDKGIDIKVLKINSDGKRWERC